MTRARATRAYVSHNSPRSERAHDTRVRTAPEIRPLSPWKRPASRWRRAMSAIRLGLPTDFVNHAAYIQT